MSKTLIVKLILLGFFLVPIPRNSSAEQCSNVVQIQSKKKTLIKHFCADASRDARRLSDFSKLQQAFYVESVTA